MSHYFANCCHSWCNCFLFICLFLHNSIFFLLFGCFSQLTTVDEEGSGGSAKNSRSSTPTPQESKVSGTPRTGIPLPGSRVTPGSARAPSRGSSTEDLRKTKRLSGLRPPSGGKSKFLMTMKRNSITKKAVFLSR